MAEVRLLAMTGVTHYYYLAGFFPPRGEFFTIFFPRSGGYKMLRASSSSLLSPEPWAPLAAPHQPSLASAFFSFLFFAAQGLGSRQTLY
jgi:hypothetical protein